VFPPEVMRYGWLTATGLGEAGCITLVAGAARRDVLDAFGAEGDFVAHDVSDAFEQPFVSIAEPTDGVVAAFEFNGFEGSRDEVLRAASKRGKAASIFWNVNGMVRFGCARRGKVLWSGELGLDDDDTGLPRGLVSLLALAENEEVDEVALGMAMVERFVGSGLDPNDVAALDTMYSVVPRMGDLPLLTPESSYLRWHRPDLVQAIAEASPQTCRALAEWAVRRGAAQVGLDDDPGVISVVDQFDGTESATWTAEASGLVARLLRDVQQAESRDQWQRSGRDDAEPGLELGWAWGRRNFTDALRHGCQNDDMSAALGAVAATLHCADAPGDADAVSEEIVQLLALDPATWPDRAHRLPTPLTAAQRAAALEWERGAPARLAEAAEKIREARDWGGTAPSDRLREAGPGCWDLARIDRALLDDLAAQTPEKQRAIAEWAVVRVLRDAGLSEIDWIAAGITAIQAGQGLPDHLRPLPFDRLFSDPQVPRTTVVGTRGETISHQAFALPVLKAADYSDPLAAAGAAVATGAAALGREFQSLFDELRTTFDL
jgi:hypothetical protein